VEILPLADPDRQQAPKKICWDFVHALLELAIWLQTRDGRSIAAGSQADKKNGMSSPNWGFGHIYGVGTGQEVEN
jgi:hypothetical protein